MYPSRINRATAAPPDARPGIERDGTRRGLRHCVRSGSIWPRSRRRGLPVQRTHDVSCSGLRGAGSGTPGAAHPSRGSPGGHGAERCGPGITRFGPKKWSYYYLYGTSLYDGRPPLQPPHRVQIKLFARESGLESLQVGRGETRTTTWISSVAGTPIEVRHGPLGTLVRGVPKPTAVWRSLPSTLLLSVESRVGSDAGDRASERVGEVQIFENGDEMTEKISRLQRNVSERSPDRPDPARVPRNRSSESLGGRGPVLSCRAQPLFDDQRTWHDRFRAVGGPEAPRLVLDHPCWEASLWMVRRTTQSPLVDREGARGAYSCAAKSTKSVALTSNAGSGVVSISRPGPYSSGRGTKAVLKPNAPAARRSPRWAATIMTFS